MHNVKIQKQLFKHDPENGVWGDCHRTAYACILELSPEYVPHFAEDGNEHFKEREQQFLRDAKLQVINIAYPGETPLEMVLDAIEAQNPGLPFILGVKSMRGTGHSVVGQGGKIVCDPSRDFKPDDTYEPLDGYWWITFVTRKL